MKYISTNITLIANEEMGESTVGQNGRIPAFIEHKHLEELRDLLFFFLIRIFGFIKENLNSLQKMPVISEIALRAVFVNSTRKTK